MQRRTPTINDVARAAGVSKTTAVFVLNNAPHFQASAATRQRVLDAAAELQYRRNGLAAALSAGKTDTIGVVVQALEEDGRARLSAYFRDIVVAMSLAATRRGRRTTLLVHTPDHPLRVQDAVDQRVDGLVLVSLSDHNLTGTLVETGYPCVGIGCGPAERRVQCDDAKGARLAVEHLLALGHRRIGYVGPLLADSSSAVARRMSFVQTLSDAKIEHPERDRVEADQIESLLDRDSATRPTAVFAFNDNVAIRVFDQARRLGLRLPEDLSVVGFDDTLLALGAWPKLTTVRNPLDELADAALELLEIVLTGADASPPAPVAPELIIRDSAAAVRVLGAGC